MNRGEGAIIVILIILILIVGFMYFNLDGKGAGVAYNPYVANSYSSVGYSGSTSSSAYDTNMPRSSATAYSRYYMPGTTTYYYYGNPPYEPAPANPFCFTSGYDAYGNPITMCQ